MKKKKSWLESLNPFGKTEQKVQRKISNIFSDENTIKVQTS